VFVANVAVVTAYPPQSRKLLTGDGVIVGISYAPAFHDQQPA
jgi:hypothetical protein